jgi:hypothetical protein
MDLLKAGLGPFGERELRNSYADRADTEARRFMGDDRLLADQPVTAWDVAALLKLMWYQLTISASSVRSGSRNAASVAVYLAEVYEVLAGNSEMASWLSSCRSTCRAAVSSGRSSALRRSRQRSRRARSLLPTVSLSWPVSILASMWFWSGRTCRPWAGFQPPSPMIVLSDERFRIAGRVVEEDTRVVLPHSSARPGGADRIDENGSEIVRFRHRAQ